MYYSPWKAVHHMSKLQQLKNGESINPVLLKIIPTNICNRKCHFCWEMETNKEFRETLDLEIIVSLLNDFKAMGGKAVELSGGGDPTMHPNFKEIVDTIRKMDLELGMATNGIKLNEDLIESLSFATWVRLSINAHSEKVYKDVGIVPPPKDDMYRLLCSKVKGVVGASFVITELNYHEIYEFAVWAKDIGFDHVRYTPFRIGKSISPTLSHIWSECEEAMAKADELADANFRVLTVANRYVAKEGMIEAIQFLDTVDKDFENCHLQQFSACVWTTGDVLPCVENRVYMETSYGNLYEKSFSEIWQGKNLLSPCDCKLPCLYYNTNNFLSYLTKPNPVHVSFV